MNWTLNMVGKIQFFITLQNCPTGALNEDFFKAMADMNLEGVGEGELDFLPLMQGMMQNLLSKDVLYPALKDLKDKVIIGSGTLLASCKSRAINPLSPTSTCIFS